MRLRSRSSIATACVLGVAACVSLSSPRGGGTGNVPVIKGGYKPGAAQIVRIALETSAKTGTISGTGRWGLVRGDVRFVKNPMEPFPLDSLTPAMRSGVVAEGQEGSLVIWNGKKYRGVI